MKRAKLKIAVLVRHFVTCGGMERYAVEISRRLRSRGHEIHLFCREADAHLAEGMIVHKVPCRWNFSSALSCLGFALDCHRLLKDERFDVIHSHEKVFIQDLLTQHTFSYKGGLYRYPLWRHLDQKWLSYRSWIYLGLEKKQMSTARLVAVSDIIRKDINRFFSVKEIDVIEPGVDSAKFSPAMINHVRQSKREELGIPDHELLVLFVGSEFKRKGLDRLIPAIGPGMRLLVLGRDPDVAFFEGLSKRHGVVGRVNFVGLVKEGIGEYYAAADVVVLPSRQEAFGMAVLEGMAFGLPVVVSREVGASSLICDGKDGFVFDSPFQVGSILKDLTNEARRKLIGAAARLKAIEYSWDKQTDKYERIFWEISGNGASL